MYVPAAFAVSDPAELQRIIREHPLGVLITPVEGGVDANHIPFALDAAHGPHGRLLAHVARANPLWQQCRQGTRVLVGFRGDEHYISPNWYPSKHESHRQVPTWNYEAVHVHGWLTVHEDERFVRGVVARLTRTHERTEPVPWRMGDSAPDYIDAMVRAIVGIEIGIERLEGKCKLGQNREPRDVAGAVAVLRTRGEEDIAHAMERPPRS